VTHDTINDPWTLVACIKHESTKMAFILRQLMDRGGDSDGSDEEEAALLEYEGGISTSEESEEEEG